MSLKITYDGKVIATLEKGQTAAIPCDGKKMLTDLVVSLVADEELPVLSTPTISLDGSMLSMTATDQETATFVILVDGVEKATVAIGAAIPSLISFTIDGTSYQAEEGMNWYEWTQSSYSNSLFSCYDASIYSNVYYDGASYHVDYNGSLVLGSDVITADAAYSLGYNTSGGGGQ